MITLIFFLFLIYLLPGFSLSRFFAGYLKKSLFFYLFLSFLVVPVIYSFLVTFNILNFSSFILFQLIFLLSSVLIGRRLNQNQKINLDNLIPQFSLNPWTIVLAVLFFGLVMSPRLGLWQGNFPIGDDQHQVRKIVSIAESTNEPLFYHFPTTRLTIYYFNNVSPGLFVKFSNNFLRANQAWFIHVGLQTALMIWFILRVGGSLLKNSWQRFFLFFSLTYFSGLEFFLYKFKGLGYIDQLEWWSDWLLPQSRVHMQITNPYNLFFWVPQHFLAALLVLLIFIFLINSEKSKITSRLFLSLLWANILGNSAFIFLSTALVYGLYMVILSIKTRSLRLMFRFNFPIIILALLLSVKNLELFLTAEKGHYIVRMANVFWFVPNSGLLNKIINLGLTVPLYLFVELGLLFFVLVYSLFKFFQDKVLRQRYLFFYLFIFIFPVIFFVKSLDDNNISMRSFIPLQIGLALFLAEFSSQMGGNRTIKFLLALVLIFISLPSGLFDFGLRLREQFNSGQNGNSSFYAWVDQNLPLKAIVFSKYTDADKVSALGHRFTFKDPGLFSATDKEHTARSQVEKYNGLDFSQEKDIAKVLRDNWDLKSQFRFYSLHALSSYKVLTGERLFNLGDLSVYPVLVDPAEVKF